MTHKILFVDDEQNILSALNRQFRKQYSVSTALSGERALQLIAEEGPFSVIVSDMQMPEMNGVQFLEAVQKLSPDSVRLMLTGNADQKTAIDAVNRGAVFSFHTKPCTLVAMEKALEKAVEQYRLITAERELLEGTLNGSVKLLMDMLSMVAPEVFSKTVALQEMAAEVSAAMALKNTWNLELAAMLSNIAYVTLPPETLAKTCSNAQLSAQEEEMVARLPEVGMRLISNIPRLEKVAEIVHYQKKHFNGGGFPDDERASEQIPLESRILKALTDLETYRSEGASASQALKRMSSDAGLYDPSVLGVLGSVLEKRDIKPATIGTTETTLTGLRTGNILAANIETIDGQMLCSAGQKITETTLQRLLNYNRITKIKEPIMVTGACHNMVADRLAG